MTVFVYVNTANQVGDKDHIKLFANQDAAEKWFEENDPEGVAFEYEVLEWTGSAAGRSTAQTDNSARKLCDIFVRRPHLSRHGLQRSRIFRIAVRTLWRSSQIETECELGGAVGQLRQYWLRSIGRDTGLRIQLVDLGMGEPHDCAVDPPLPARHQRRARPEDQRKRLNMGLPGSGWR
jgi:hypothetical protein